MRTLREAPHGRPALQGWGLLTCFAFGLGHSALADTDHYARCAACHLADGAGVPGMFPPLAGNAHRFFASPEGRSYLASLVVGGANGAIEIQGVSYLGVMPAVVADLSDAEVAKLLNGLVRRFGPPGSPGVRLFAPADVADARAAGPLSHTERVALRERALAAAVPGRHARSDWLLHCSGCHGAEGTLSTPGMVALRGRVAQHVRTPAGRARLVQVPGVANATLSDARLADTLNWMLATFDREHLPEDFDAFTGDEVGALRRSSAPGDRTHTNE